MRESIGELCGVAAANSQLQATNIALKMCVRTLKMLSK